VGARMPMYGHCHSRMYCINHTCIVGWRPWPELSRSRPRWIRER
jgi:hypothetical protein